MRHTSSARCIAAVLVCWAVLVLPGRAAADLVMFKDGRVVEGRVTDKTDKELTVEIRKGGNALSMRYKMDEVKEVVADAPPVVAGPATRPATQPAAGAGQPPAPAKTAARPSGPTYLIAPIHGTIGLDVNDALLKHYLTIAANEKPDVMILDFDSPGGSVGAMADMIDLIQKHKGPPIVAYVRNAHSAAAILAMSCRKIVMAPGSSIGGAVAFKVGPWGTPENIEEKFQSIYRAKCRSAVEAAGHNPLLAEAMIRTDLVLSRTVAGAVVTISEGAGGGAGRRVIKERGRILTLTSEEAIACGLAAGACDEVAACGKLLGYGELTERSRSAVNAYGTAKRNVGDAAKRYALAVRRALDALAQAVEQDPTAYRYNVDRATGAFTDESNRDWKKRCEECSKALKQAATNLNAAKNIIKGFPQLQFHPDLADIQFSPDSLEDGSKKLAALAKVIDGERKRSGV